MDWFLYDNGLRHAKVKFENYFIVVFAFAIFKLSSVHMFM